jgi:molybdenum cofactor cytidylyltransferase
VKHGVQCHAAEVISGHVNPGCRKLITEHPDVVFIHETAHGRYTTGLDTPKESAAILARLAQTPAAIADAAQR